MKSGDLKMELVRRYLGGDASKEEALSLEAMLATDAQLRRDFLAYARVDAALFALARPPLLKTSPPPTHRFWRPLATAAAAAAVLLTGLVWRFLPVTTPVLGTVTQVLNAESSGEGNRPEAGQTVGAGRISLSLGAMEITLSNGVAMMFEGPGELELLTPMRAHLHSGQVVVRVPQNAVGFQLNAASVQVVDLGTEFGLKAGPGLKADVQVFEGLVEASPAQGGFTRRMTAGNAARYTAEASTPKPLVYSPARFIRQVPREPGIPLPTKMSKHEFPAARHSEVVIPKPIQPIRIDGDLSEWDAEGLFSSEADPSRSVEGRMRYNSDAIYIAAHIKDPAPMRSAIDPAMDGELGWKGGGLQVRLSLDRSLGWPLDASTPSYYRMRGLTAGPEQIKHAMNQRLVTLTLWHHEPTQTDCLHLAFGTNYSGGEVNPPGYSATFRRDPDDRGYTIEARIPWEVLHVQDDPPKEGDVLAACWNVHWCDPSGRVWRSNLVDIRNSTEPLRIYDYERAATWGRAIYR